MMPDAGDAYPLSPSTVPHLMQGRKPSPGWDFQNGDGFALTQPVSKADGATVRAHG